MHHHHMGGGGGFGHHHHHHHNGGIMRGGAAFVEGAMIGAAVASTARPVFREEVVVSTYPAYTGTARNQPVTYTIKNVNPVNVRRCGLLWFFIGLIILIILAAAVPKPGNFYTYLEEGFEMVSYCESPVITSYFDISVDTGVSVYKSAGLPPIDSFVNATINQNLMVPPDDYQYWGYNLFAGSTIHISWHSTQRTTLYIDDSLSDCSYFGDYSNVPYAQRGVGGIYTYTATKNALVCIIFDNETPYSYGYGSAVFNVTSAVYNVTSGNEHRVPGCVSGNGCRVPLVGGSKGTSCVIFVPHFDPQSSSELQITLNASGNGLFWGLTFGLISLFFFILTVACCKCDARANKKARMEAAMKAQVPNNSSSSAYNTGGGGGQIPTAPPIEEEGNGGGSIPVAAATTEEDPLLKKEQNYM